MIFDAKMEYFRRKARLVVGVHVMEPPATIPYVIVVLRDKVRIAMILAALNDLPVKVADIQNTYTTVPVTDKWMVLVQESDKDTGRKAVVVWSLYGLKSGGSDFWNHLADCIHHLGFLPCPDDLDLWMKPMSRTEGGSD